MKDLKLFQQFAPQAEEQFISSNNAVIYTRVSSVDQEDNTSLGSQKKYCETFAQRKGLNVVTYFGGTYESAKTDDRKEFGRMLNFVKRSKNISYIIVYSYDRFSRSGMNGAQIADDLLKKYGIVTLAVTQELDPTTSTGSFQQKIMFLLSQMDNEQRREKVVTGMKENLLNGYWVWEVPRGYTDLNKGAKADKRQIVVNDYGRKLKKAFEWKAYKNMSNVDICRKLKALGINLSDKRLNNIFSNIFYCGLIKSKMLPNQIIQGHHEAMVSKELFLEVNDVRSENRVHGFVMNQDNENLPLKVFTKCDKCHQSLTGYLVKKKGLYYYKCSTKGCKVNRSAKAMHQLFKDVLSLLHVDKEELEVVKIQLQEQFGNFFKSQVNEQKLLKANLSGVKKKLDTIEERYALAEIDKAMYLKFKAKYEKEYIAIDKKLSGRSVTSSNLSKVIDFTVKICTNSLLLWEKADYHTKKVLQELVFPQGISYNRELDQYRTRRINLFFSAIVEFTGVLKRNKKGDLVVLDQISSWVVPPGLEPGTT